MHVIPDTQTTTSTLLFAGLDLPADREVDVLAWHTEEHLPERLALPGFNRGRRFICLDGSPKFLILYELAGLDVLRSAPYLERLNNPTPWTSRSLPEFRNNFRTAFKVLGAAGNTSGGYFSATRVPPDALEALNDHLVELAAARGIGRVVLALPDREHSTIATAESHASGNAVLDTPMLFVEAADLDALDDLGQSLKQCWTGMDRVGRYQLQAERTTANPREQ